MNLPKKSFNMTGSPFKPMDKEDMMDHGADEAQENAKKPSKGKGILKALGEKKASGNFKKIAKAQGKGAAIAALQNKLAKRRGLPIPFKKGGK